MKKIVFPTDFSDNSWSAIVYALKLFQNEICTFYFLHSSEFHYSTMSNLSNKLLRTIESNALKDLQSTLKQAQSIDVNSNHKFESLLSSQPLIEAIRATVNDHNINYVVMGTKGATGAKSMFFGSNTTTVIKKMRDCPILVVPDEYDFVVPKQIAYPSDFNRFLGPREYKPIREIAKLHDSAIRIMHINEEEELDEIQKYNRISIEECFKKFDHSFHWMPKFAKKSTEIEVFIQDLEIDMLALVNYKHSFIEDLIREPVIKKIGFHPIVPFLVIPE